MYRTRLLPPPRDLLESPPEAQLLTYSGHRALRPDARTGLFDCITHLVNARFGGRVTKRYLTELRVARRRG